MCNCWKRKKKAVASGEEVPWPGEFGFLELSYTGKATDERTWRGLETRTPYKFAPGNSKLVEKRDAPQFLAPLGGGKVFKLARSDEDDQT